MDRLRDDDVLGVWALSDPGLVLLQPALGRCPHHLIRREALGSAGKTGADTVMAPQGISTELRLRVSQNSQVTFYQR